MTTTTKEKQTINNGSWFYGRITTTERIGGTFLKMELHDRWGNSGKYLMHSIDDLKNNHYFNHGSFYFTKKAYEMFINEQ